MGQINCCKVTSTVLYGEIKKKLQLPQGHSKLSFPQGTIKEIGRTANLPLCYGDVYNVNHPRVYFDFTYKACGTVQGTIRPITGKSICFISLQSHAEGQNAYPVSMCKRKDVKSFNFLSRKHCQDISWMSSSTLGAIAESH